MPSSLQAAQVIHDVGQAAQLLQEGALVAFPTETVYGLGANALNPHAVSRVFTVKGRPPSDPLIVHVPDPTAIPQLVTLPGGEAQQALVSRLAQAFWPGPLTLVLPASTLIPPAITAGTGWVGIRCPRHPMALQLLQEAKVPIAAPSANRFGHVSPTSADHVLEDLGDHDIYVLQDSSKEGVMPTDSSKVGIESTVIKVDWTNKEVIILRSGAVTKSQLERVLATTSTPKGPFKIIRGGNKGINNSISTNSEGGDTVTQPGGQRLGREEGDVAPGQSIKHYAPDVPTFLFPSGVLSLGGLDLSSDSVRASLASCLVIDFYGQLAPLASLVADYRDLSPGGDVHQAAAELFDTLRWAEKRAVLPTPSGGTTTITTVLLCDIRDVMPYLEDQEEREFGEALQDRLTRAASGRTITSGQLGL